MNRNLKPIQGLISVVTTAVAVNIVVLPIIYVIITLTTHFELAYGGCYSDKTNYGWPVSILTIIKSCGTCCDESAIYPVHQFSNFGLLADSIYFLSFVYLLTKVIRLFIKHKK